MATTLWPFVDPCASDDPSILPTIDSGTGEPKQCSASGLIFEDYQALETWIPIYPARLWVALSALVCLLCVAHFVMLSVADYRSPVTRDLAIRDNDQPRRRSMYVHVATAALFSMAFIVSFPLCALSFSFRINPGSWVGIFAGLSCGLLAVAATFYKTWGYVGWAPPDPLLPRLSGLRGKYERARANVYFFFNLLAWTTLVLLPALWCYLCVANSATLPLRDSAHRSLYLVGLSFSYRCIHPDSGVSPVVPVLLLLFSWYLWGVFQTRRLRFSESARPRLPERLEDEVDGHLFVSDNELRDCGGPQDSCLYRKMTCLLITRHALCRVWRRPKPSSVRGTDIAVDLVLVIAYAGFLFGFSFFNPITSVDHFLWNTGKYLASPYEFLVGLLFFPLLLISLAGWLRMMLIWRALKDGLLERLEDLPIRFAFSRLKAMGWMTMLRQSGSQEQWRDMVRSLESARQMLHDPALERHVCKEFLGKLIAANEDLLGEFRQLYSYNEKQGMAAQPQLHEYEYIKRIETKLAGFGRSLLSIVLIPHWKNERVGLVESELADELCSKARNSETDADQSYLPMQQRAGTTQPVSIHILAAEEFVAIRYLSLIRAVLANLRYLMIFVSASFVLAIMAWNSYPFQPRQYVDWLFTGLLAFLGLGIVLVFAQMHRNPILSRITDTRANELGWDFYLRVISFGAVPLLAWLAYQYPDIGGAIYRFVQPGIPMMK